MLKKAGYVSIIVCIVLMYGCSRPLPPIESISTNVYNPKDSQLPIYDINTVPISFWTIKDGEDNVGFIVAGHAEKAICKAASLEVINIVKEIGEREDSVFTFGVAYDLRPKLSISNKWSANYSSTISKMENKFRELAKNYPGQVKVNKINYADYNKVASSLKDNIAKVRNSKDWDRHIVEYKYHSSPIIVPFYSIENGEKTVFKMKKSIFGVTPVGAAIMSFKREIESAVDEIKKMREQNSNELQRLLESFKGKRKFKIYRIQEDIVVLEEYTIDSSLPKAPPGFQLQTIDATTGMVLETRDVTADEATKMLKDSSVTIDPTARKLLQEWIDDVKNHSRKIDKVKSDLKNVINDANNVMEKQINELLALMKKIQEQNDESIVIDAFLRGWAFSTGNLSTNKRLDDWYRERRKVWDTILRSVNLGRNNNNMAGAFHSDNVFFKVVTRNDIYEITPYYIVGDDFIQVIDKRLGISQIVSPFNFR